MRVSARVVDKPWGHEEIFAETANYVGKILFIREGEALSLQYHEVKEETLRVLDGELELVTGEDEEHLESHYLGTGAVFHIAPGTLHRMIGTSDCRLLEVSTNHLDDVVRLDDRYGREGTSAP
ncbi:MAG: cupin domain-containing protein [Acidobacteria bacterium]|jgi:mannose-6-phosphate isomerase-like protein (cupin superfamily)|nr:cupin domain-containing protein [Acidobacteriota bacterium]